MSEGPGGGGWATSRRGKSRLHGCGTAALGCDSSRLLGIPGSCRGSAGNLDLHPWRFSGLRPLARRVQSPEGRPGQNGGTQYRNRSGIAGRNSELARNRGTQHPFLHHAIRFFSPHLPPVCAGSLPSARLSGGSPQRRLRHAAVWLTIVVRSPDERHAGWMIVALRVAWLVEVCLVVNAYKCLCGLAHLASTGDAGSLDAFLSEEKDSPGLAGAKTRRI